jgi:hypothetical protein
LKRFSNNRVRIKILLSEDQRAYLQDLSTKLTVLSGKKLGLSDVLGGIVDHYRLEQKDEKTK